MKRADDVKEADLNMWYFDTEDWHKPEKSWER